MDSTTNLFIRACKHNTTRVYKVYRRFYCDTLTKEQEHYEIANLLIHITDKYNLISDTELMHSLSPISHWNDTSNLYWEKLVFILISAIKLTIVKDVFPEFRSPLRFRN